MTDPDDPRRDLRELERALRESEARARFALARERALHRVTQGLARDRTVREMAGTVLDGVELFDATMIYVGSVDPSGTTVEMLASRGYGSDTPDGFSAVPIDAQAPIAEAVRTGRTVTADRQGFAERYPSRLSLIDRLGIEAVIVQPVFAGDTVAACIALSYAEPHRTSDEERTLLETLARLFGQSLERASAYEAELETRAALERAMSRLGRLQAVTASLTPQLRTDEIAAAILRQATKALGADAAGLFVPDGRGGLTPLGSFGGDEGWDGASEVRVDSPLAIAEAFRSGHTVWVPTQAEWRRRYPAAPADYHQGAAGVLAVPLVVEGGVRGVLGLLFHRERALRKDERRLATTIGHQAAQALERARLYESERRLAERTARLQEITVALAAAVTPSEIADVLAGMGTETLGATSCLVGTLEPDGRHVRLLGRHPGEDEIVSLEDEPSMPGIDALLSRGRVIVDETLVDTAAETPDGGSAGSSVSVPLLTDAGAIGFLTIGFPHGEGQDGSTLDLIRTLAAQTSQAMDRARLFSTEHEVARVLQESMLPPTHADAPTFEVATRYQPSADHLEVGGDWFEVVHLSGDRLGIAVGDVVGRGLNAAAAMGQLRSALRALALQGIGPIRVLDALETFATQTPGAQLSSVVYGEVDPDTGEFRFASAGHPPPMLEHQGAVEVLEGGRSPLLGVGSDQPRPDHVLRIPPGATLVLYTDGLVERRGEAFDRGVQRLGRALRATSPLELEERCDQLLSRMLDGVERDDDVALLCIRRAPDAEQRFRAWVAPEPSALGGLRHRADAWLRARCLEDDDVDAAVLALNEAVANAIEHGAAARRPVVVVQAEITDGDELVMTVRDHGRWLDRRSAEDRGRGLLLMQALMDEVRIDRSERGTMVTLRRRVTARTPS